jgi:hypothetical protein
MPLLVGIILNLLFVVIETVVGLTIHSLSFFPTPVIISRMWRVWGYLFLPFA